MSPSWSWLHEKAAVQSCSTSVERPRDPTHPQTVPPRGRREMDLPPAPIFHWSWRANCHFWVCLHGHQWVSWPRMSRQVRGRNWAAGMWEGAVAGVYCCGTHHPKLKQQRFHVITILQLSVLGRVQWSFSIGLARACSITTGGSPGLTWGSPGAE